MKQTYSIITLFLVVALIASMVCVCGFTVSSQDEVTIKYTIDFEEEGAGTILQVNDVPVGEIVEYPEGSGNHCLRYEINGETRFSVYGCHPYMWPEGIEKFLIEHGDLQSGEEIRLMADIATDGPADRRYMYPTLLVNNERMDWRSQCGIFCPGENELKTGEWIFTSYGEDGPPQEGLNIFAEPVVEYRSGGICFCDENWLEENTYIYMDNIMLSFRGDWEMDPDNPWTYLDNENPLPVEITGNSTTTTTTTTTETSTTETTITETTTTTTTTTPQQPEIAVKYTIDFEEEGAGTILQVNGVPVGEIVEYPIGSGNHCLCYEINGNTRTGYGNHPYIWPNGLDEILLAHGDLKEGEKIRLRVDMSTDCPTRDSYMYPYMVVNNKVVFLQSECGVYRPGENELKTGEWTFNSYGKGGPPQEENYKNGGMGFCDEETLAENAFIYMDNIELSFYGDWEPSRHVSMTYLNDNTPLPVEIFNATETTQSTQTTQSSQTTQSTQTTQTEYEPVVNGDANGDGELDMKDVLAIRKYIAGMDVTVDVALADYNQDLIVDMKDVLAVRKKIAGV